MKPTPRGTSIVATSPSSVWSSRVSDTPLRSFVDASRWLEGTDSSSVKLNCEVHSSSTQADWTETRPVPFGPMTRVEKTASSRVPPLLSNFVRLTAPSCRTGQPSSAMTAGSLATSRMAVL